MNFLTIVMIVAMAVIIALVYKDGKQNKPVDAPIIKVDTFTTMTTDTVYLTHTQTIVKPQPTRVDTLYRVDTVTKEKVMDICKVYENDSSLIVRNDTDSARVDYHLYIATRNSDVDSVGLRFGIDYPKVTKTQYITKEITQYKKQHFTYGIQAGVGYGLINKKPDVFIGIGGQYRW